MYSAEKKGVVVAAPDDISLHPSIHPSIHPPLTVGTEEFREGVLHGVHFRPEEEHVLAEVGEARHLDRVRAGADVHVHGHGRRRRRRVRAQEDPEAVGEHEGVVRALVQRRLDDLRGGGGGVAVAVAARGGRRRRRRRGGVGGVGVVVVGDDDCGVGDEGRQGRRCEEGQDEPTPRDAVGVVEVDGGRAPGCARRAERR